VLVEVQLKSLKKSVDVYQFFGFFIGQKPKSIGIGGSEDDGRKSPEKSPDSRDPINVSGAVDDSPILKNGLVSALFRIDFNLSSDIGLDGILESKNEEK